MCGQERCGNRHQPLESGTTNEPRVSDDKLLLVVREFGARRIGREPPCKGGFTWHMASNGTGAGAGAPTRLATRSAEHVASARGGDSPSSASEEGCLCRPPSATPCSMGAIRKS